MTVSTTKETPYSYTACAAGCTNKAQKSPSVSFVMQADNAGPSPRPHCPCCEAPRFGKIEVDIIAAAEFFLDSICRLEEMLRLKKGDLVTSALGVASAQLPLDVQEGCC